jgi:2-methylisocitrate lyase-like PEP mutase family enzyme
MPAKTHHAEESVSRMSEAYEHVRAARSSIHQSFEELIPHGFLEHRKAARKEMLLAMRSLLDAAIERADGRPPE